MSDKVLTDIIWRDRLNISKDKKVTETWAKDLLGLFSIEGASRLEVLRVASLPFLDIRRKTYPVSPCYDACRQVLIDNFCRIVVASFCSSFVEHFTMKGPKLCQMLFLHQLRESCSYFR